MTINEFNQLVDSIKKEYAGFEEIPSYIVTAQAVHESGWFTSSIFKENNNPFGLKQPSQRPTKATGSNRGHATYDSVQDSIHDYFMRQTYFNRFYWSTLPDAETAYMKSTVTAPYAYAEDPNYLARWQSVTAKVKGALMASNTVAGGVNFISLFVTILTLITFFLIYRKIKG